MFLFGKQQGFDKGTVLFGFTDDIGYILIDGFGEEPVLDDKIIVIFDDFFFNISGLRCTS